MTGVFLQAFIYLCAAVIAVPIAKKIGLGSVLGYLVAGAIIGPITGIVGGDEAETIQHFAEFGVVMMLFLVGLELDPKMLWGMRVRLLGLGGLQLILTTSFVMLIANFFDMHWQESVTIGFILSLSSTAIVLQTFNEKGWTKTQGGRNAFSVLLFQDIAVIPMLALIPLLALPELVGVAENVAHSEVPELSLVAHLPNWAVALVIPSTILGVVGAGYYFSHHLFNFVAASGVREIFTATALMLVIGISALMNLIGLSPALGTFLAGVVLANSAFRHELESNIEPFKGLLLGLFFITVGANIDVDVLMANFLLIVLLSLGLMLLKALVLLAIAYLFKIRSAACWLFSLSLAQAGEFGFVLLNFAKQNNALASDTTQILLLVVALSMFLTPLLFMLYEKVILPRIEANSNQQNQPDDEIDEKGTVIIAGVGRFGQVVNRMLRSNGVQTVVLDHQASQIENLRKLNIKSYFGDATNHDLLHQAGIEEARLFVVAMDNQQASTELVQYIKNTYPKLTVLARAFDRDHYYKLLDVGADHVEAETFHSALELGTQALRSLDVHPFLAEQQKAKLLAIEKKNTQQLYQSWKESEENHNYINLFLQVEQSIYHAMETDRLDKHSMTEREWTPPPKEFLEDVSKEN